MEETQGLRDFRVQEGIALAIVKAILRYFGDSIPPPYNESVAGFDKLFELVIGALALEVYLLTELTNAGGHIEIYCNFGFLAGCVPIPRWSAISAQNGAVAVPVGTQGLGLAFTGSTTIQEVLRKDQVPRVVVPIRDAP